MLMTITTFAEDSLATQITCKVSPGNSDSRVPLLRHKFFDNEPVAFGREHASTTTRYRLEGTCMEECVADEKSMCCGLTGSTAVSWCITRRDQLRFIRGHIIAWKMTMTTTVTHSRKVIKQVSGDPTDMSAVVMTAQTKEPIKHVCLPGAKAEARTTLVTL